MLRLCCTMGFWGIQAASRSGTQVGWWVFMCYACLGLGDCGAVRTQGPQQGAREGQKEKSPSKTLFCACLGCVSCSCPAWAALLSPRGTQHRRGPTARGRCSGHWVLRVLGAQGAGCSGCWVLRAAGAAHRWVLSVQCLRVLMDLCRLLECEGSFVSKLSRSISKEENGWSRRRRETTCQAKGEPVTGAEGTLSAYPSYFSTLLHIPSCWQHVCLKTQMRMFS